LAAAPDLGSGGVIRVGSNPSICTKKENKENIMKRIQENGTFGYSRYLLNPNSNNFKSFFVYTEDKKIYNMMSDLCSLNNIDEEISNYVKRRDFNYIQETDIARIHANHF
jgi:hypothetical protein